MKLAQALADRAAAQQRIEQLRSRLTANAKVQQGEEPAENPQELLAQLDQTTVQLAELIVRINLTNAQTTADGQTLTQLLAHRDCLRLKVGVLRDFLDSASATVMRATHSEIKILPSVAVAPLQKQVDALSKELRELEGRIQELNWTTELI